MCSPNVDDESCQAFDNENDCITYTNDGGQTACYWEARKLHSSHIVLLGRQMNSCRKLPTRR